MAVVEAAALVVVTEAASAGVVDEGAETEEEVAFVVEETEGEVASVVVGIEAVSVEVAEEAAEVLHLVKSESSGKYTLDLTIIPTSSHAFLPETRTLP